MKEVKTEVFIKSNPEKVWNVLTNLNGWKEWNPTVQGVTGEAKVGNKLEVMMKGMGGKPDTLLKPTISKLEDHKSLVWTISMAAGLLFKYQKVIELEKSDEGTMMKHTEFYGGLIPSLFWSQFKHMVKPTLTSMNGGLKKKVEQ